jgi:hypothetical protein
MTISTAEQVPADNYLSALTELGKIIIAVSQPMVTLYQQQSLAIRPEIFIGLYCRCLEFILQHKITGNKEQLQALMINTIEQNTEHGERLYQIITLSNAKDSAQIDKFSADSGLIIMPVLKLSQFISDAIKSTAANAKAFTADEIAQLETLLDIPLQEVFELVFQASVQKIHALQIANPLIFFLEHFSIILGWLAGFFAPLSQKSTTEFLAENMACLRVSN